MAAKRALKAPTIHPDGSIEWPLKFGRGYLVLMIASLALMVGATALVWLDPDARPIAWIVTAISAGSIALIAALTYPTRYRFSAEALEIRVGLFRFRVVYAEIRSLDLRTSFLSSMTAGWTFERVALTRARGFPLELGPDDRLGFVAEVLARAPQLIPDPRGEPGRAWVADRA